VERAELINKNLVQKITDKKEILEEKRQEEAKIYEKIKKITDDLYFK